MTNLLVQIILMQALRAHRQRTIAFQDPACGPGQQRMCDAFEHAHSGGNGRYRVRVQSALDAEASSMSARMLELKPFV